MTEPTDLFDKLMANLSRDPVTGSRLQSGPDETVELEGNADVEFSNAAVLPVLERVERWPKSHLVIVFGVTDPAVVQSWSIGSARPSVAQLTILKVLEQKGAATILEPLGLHVPDANALEADDG